jgi:hypothetical protein
MAPEAEKKEIPFPLVKYEKQFCDILNANVSTNLKLKSDAPLSVSRISVE